MVNRDLLSTSLDPTQEGGSGLEASLKKDWNEVGLCCAVLLRGYG